MAQRLGPSKYERHHAAPTLQTTAPSLQDRLTAWATEVRKQALTLPPGPERDAVLKKAGQADTTAHRGDRANSRETTDPEVVRWRTGHRHMPPGLFFNGAFLFGISANASRLKSPSY